MEKLLQISNLNKSFEGIKAIDDLSLEIYHNEIIGLIGPNGAGKTTLFNVEFAVKTLLYKFER